MKYLLILLFFLVYLENLIQAQDTFFKIFPGDYFDQAFDAIETSNGDYLIIGERALTNNEDTAFGYILKIDSEGQVIQESLFGNASRSTRYSFINKQPESNQYILGGWTDSINQDTIFSRIIIQLINEELNILGGTTYSTHQNHVLHPWKSQIIYDSLLYILSYYYPPSSDCQISIIKVKLPFDSITTYHSTPPAVHLPHNHLYIPNDSLLQVFYMGSLFSRSAPTKILQLNMDLEYISTLEGPPNILTSVYATGLNDTSYLLTGSGITPGYAAKQHIIVYALNFSNDTIKKLEYLNNPDTILYAGGGSNTIVNSQSIYITGIYNLDPSAPYLWQTTPTWIQLTKLDLDLNIISHHFYGGNQLYIPYSIIPVSTGGALITGFTWDYNIPGNLCRNIFVLKVDSSGAIVYVPEGATWHNNEAIICPNPSSDYFVAVVGAQYTDATLFLYDLKGRQVLKQDLQQQQTRVSSESIPSGSFVYRFISGKKVIGEGKWVKL